MTVWEGSLFVSARVAEEYGDAIRAAAPQARLTVAEPGGGPPDFEDIEALFFSQDIFPERAREFAVAALKAPNLRWMHTFSAGVDDPFFGSLQARGVRLTTSAGAHAVPIAQTVILYLLALSRDLPGWLADQRAHRWNPRDVRDLQGLHLGVVGFGPIGRAVAELGLALGMRVTGVRRAAVGDEPCAIVPLEGLDALCPELDAIVLALPLSDATRGLFGPERLAGLKPGCLFVNVGRGGLVDEPALIEALASGAIGGAGLDVFETEPLPETSRLWEMPNVIITPHSSGANPGNGVRSAAIFLENLSAYSTDRPLRNEAARPPDPAP